MNQVRFGFGDVMIISLFLFGFSSDANATWFVCAVWWFFALGSVVDVQTENIMLTEERCAQWFQ